ncbi:MAG: hypothetical protein KDD94_06220 [Calditrichaeota bacterium]|nr:hypothetical protein [Calditrichota bacterium]
MKCFKYLVFPFFVVGCFTTGERGDNGGGVFADPEKQALLMGTFHYHNPGADVAKTKAFDILSEGSQEQLDSLTKLIRDFNPSKIFVEWSFKEQRELDSLYQLYRQGIYFDNPGLSDFYRKNEIFQLLSGSRIACV